MNEKLYSALKPYKAIEWKKDSYILEDLHNTFLVNNADKELILLNDTLEIIKKVELYDELSIYQVFLKFDKTAAVLDCPENNVLVLVNLITNQVDYIKNNHTVHFSDQRYSWKESLILSTHEGSFFLLDPLQQHITLIPENTVKLYDPFFLVFHEFFVQHSVVRSYPDKYQCLYRNYEKKVICFYSMKDAICVIVDYNPDEEFKITKSTKIHHYFDYINYGIFIFLSEESIVIRKNNNNVFLYPPSDTHTFIRVITRLVKDYLHMTVLGYNKSYQDQSCLWQYCIPQACIST